MHLGRKGQHPDIHSIIQRLNALENLYDGRTQKTPPSEFFQWCFSIKTFRKFNTLEQIYRGKMIHMIGSLQQLCSVFYMENRTGQNYA